MQIAKALQKLWEIYPENSEEITVSTFLRQRRGDTPFRITTPMIAMRAASYFEVMHERLPEFRLVKKYGSDRIVKVYLYQGKDVAFIEFAYQQRLKQCRKWFQEHHSI